MGKICLIFYLSFVLFGSGSSKYCLETAWKPGCCLFPFHLASQKFHLNLPKSSPYPGLQLLELFLPSLQCQLLSLIQTVLQVLHCLVQVLLHPLQVGTGVSLHLLLQPQGFIPAPDLSIQGALHGVHNSLVVSLQLVNLLILLCYLPVNLSLHLVELKLQPQDLPLFMFQGVG
uniref:Uncharacterized protein n=1 Tax=Ficedula albicollis TaxID=59894 RepID=A0A803W705_FICAL